MEQVDVLFLNGTVVTMDGCFTLIPDGGVAVRGSEIIAVAASDALRAAYTAADIVECAGRVIMPGLVNAHTHVPMTLFRGLNDDLRLDVWLGYLMPIEREFVNPDTVRLGTELACAEMIRSGITAFADMYYFEEVIAETTAAIGLRALLGQTILMFPAPDAAVYEEGLQRCREFIEAWNGHELIQPAVAPHAWYTATPDLLEACAALAREYDVPLHTHISETALEVHNCREEHGKTPVYWNNNHGLLDTKLLAAHCVHIDRGEMHLLKRAGAGVAHNPTSNLKLSSGIAPVAEMLEVGLNVGIGTDGPASNNDLDMFEEMRLAALLAKIVRSDPTDLPARQALALATIGGARALHAGHLTGSLEPGKRADLIVVDMDGVHNTPHFSGSEEAVYSRLVYAAKSTDVAHVLCHGRWLMRERELLTVDEARAREEAAGVAARIDAFVLRRESSPYHKLVTLETVERQEEYETQIKVALADPSHVLAVLDSGRLEVAKYNTYRQYDHYFIFDQAEPDAARLRFREDHYIDDRGDVYQSRSRLTLIGSTHLREFPNSIMLSRSRFLAPATRSLRFYKEYFEAPVELDVVKLRRRWRINYKEADIAVNLDQVTDPAVAGYFLEVKSRTWSARDAERKVALIAELLDLFGIDAEDALRSEYVDLVTDNMVV